MSHKKKENVGRKRKPTIPYMRVIPTEKQKENRMRKLTEHDIEEIGSLIRFKEMFKEQRIRHENTPSMTYNAFEHESNESILPNEENDSRRLETRFTADKERDDIE